VTSELSKINARVIAEKDQKRFPVKSEAHSLLWSCRMKTTKPRLDLVNFLFAEKRPLSAADIRKKIDGKIDLATTYRTLERLAKAGLVQKIKSPNLDKAEYEIKSGRSHHHHAICASCGETEDIFGCDGVELDVSARAQLKKFKSIQGHSLEFFGLCRRCEIKATK